MDRRNNSGQAPRFARTRSRFHKGFGRQAGQAPRLRSGQAMLLAVLALGGAVLSATAIAGFLIAYQIRETTDFTNSAKAIFAADAGTEWALYSHFVNASTTMTPFNNGATVTVACSDANGADISCGDPAAESAVSKGFALDTARAFLLTFNGATSTGP